MRQNDHQPISTPFHGDDLLWRQLKTIPAFRALLRAVEARFYQVIDLPGPVLDVGCGDGHFAQMTFDRKLAAGIDPWWNPLKKAQRTAVYDVALQALGDDLPFLDGAFASAFSNSVLEHIPDVQPVLDEVGRVLQPHGRFVITTPSHYFTEFLGGAEFFTRLGLDGMADRYRSFFNTISRHAHTDPPEVWAERLAQAGFAVERWQYYFSREALHALEIGHVQGVPSAILHAVTGHWILGPWESSLRPTERWIRPFYDEPFPAQGAYILLIARKVADGPIEAELPPAMPFSLAELRAATSEPALGDDGAAPLPASAPAPAASAAEPEPAPEPLVERRPINFSGYVAAALVVIAFLAAVLAQSALRATPTAPGRGLTWLAVTAVSLLLLAWQRRGGLSLPNLRVPRVREIPRARWLYPVALLLAFVAQRFADSGGAQRPSLALLLWLAGIAVAFYALHTPAPPAATTRPRAGRFTLIAAAALFVVALFFRLYMLGEHPFILNGTEANIGLDALSVLNGTIRNPFATAWLTNPTLPLYLLSLPLGLLGPSTLAVRLLSALVGALTVVATFLIGRRLYGRAVGLAAAILLLGSHFHLQFSRLGLTNVWDALLTLLALGLIAIAWQQEAAVSRPTWLLAGTAVGLSAYLYTSSHLLPIMLAVLLLLVLLFERGPLAENWWHVVVAAALALVIALPQLLYYLGAPGVFMERAVALGILDSQSGWLSAEATRTGLSRWALWQQQFWQAALAFNATLDRSTSYGAFRPLLSFFPGVLALMGFVIALLHLHRLRYSLLVVWVAVTIIFAGVLLENPPNSHRLIIAAPALALLAAVALVRLVELLLALRERPPTENGAAPLLLAVGLLAGLLASADLFFYFTTYRVEHRFGDRNTEVANDMAEYLNRLGDEWTAYFYGPPVMYAGFPTLPFLAQEFREGVNLIDIPAGQATMPPANGPAVYIALPERQGELAAVADAYPEGELQVFNGYYGSPLFVAYEVRP